MTPIYSLFGGIAGTNRRLQAIRIKGVSLSTWCMIFLPLIAAFAWAVAVRDHSLVAWLLLGTSSIALGALSLCRFNHDIVFQATPELTALANEKAVTAIEMPDCHASGRFTLWEGDRTRWQRTMDRLISGTRGDRWFLEVPARLVVHDRRLFAFTADLDPSIRFLGMRLENKAGMWTIVGLCESVEALEFGILHLGFKHRPAIRVRFENAERKLCRVVLTFIGDDHRRAFANYLAHAVGSMVD